MLPFSQACENNKASILSVLKSAFAPSKRVLEIGSGTGQHAVHMATHLPQLTWMPSDQKEYLEGIQARLDQEAPQNIAALQELDVRQTNWPVDFDAAFSANTAHIMSWETASHMLENVAERLPSDGVFALYGPFKYNGEFTSESNAHFDAHLKLRDPLQGVRDFEKVNAIVSEKGMILVKDHSMPANNQLIVWKKI